MARSFEAGLPTGCTGGGVHEDESGLVEELVEGESELVGDESELVEGRLVPVLSPHQVLTGGKGFDLIVSLWYC